MSPRNPILVIVLFLIVLTADPLLAAPQIGPIVLSANTVGVYEKIELTIPLMAQFKNPFDPREIEVEARFSGPDQRHITMPAFLYREYSRALEKGKEQVFPVGYPDWKVRFAAGTPGNWRCRITARDATGRSESHEIWFEVTPAARRGYIHLHKGDRYFSYDDGNPLLLIGENVAWASSRGTYNFDTWLPPAGMAGLNCARIWLQWNKILTIESKRSGSGRYDLANAWRMDYVLDLARRSGVHVFFCLDSPEPYQKEHYWLGQLTRRPWLSCPHNVANGGPLKEPQEFYTSKEARRLIRQRLRYIIARWGWDPNICCWELWNEQNCFPGWEKLVPEIVAWHKEMIQELRGLDPYDRAITTSFNNPFGHDKIWNVTSLDFVQSHTYGAKQMGRYFSELALNMMNRYRRPHIIGEFGPSGKVLQDLPKADPSGEHLHNAIWSTVMSGSLGTALTWCWDFYIHKCDLYSVFTPLTRFCDGVPWNAAKLQPAATRLSWAKPQSKASLTDLVIEGDRKRMPQTDATIRLATSGAPMLFRNMRLDGSNHQEKQKALVFDVDYSDAGQFIVRIGRVWVLGIIEATLDGKKIGRVNLPTGPGKGPWHKSEFSDRWKVWAADYDKDIAFKIPAGKHRLQLYNAGKDHIEIDRITLTNYLTEVKPDLHCSAIAGNGIALLWVQNGAHTWENIVAKRKLDPIRDARITLLGIPPGQCRVEWWDTYAGKVSKTDTLTAGEDNLSLDLPPVEKDIACKITW